MLAWAAGDSLDYFAVKVDPGKELMAERILGYRNILARVPTVSYEGRIHRKSKRTTTFSRPWLQGLVFVAFPKLDDDGNDFTIPWFALRQRLHIIRGVIGMTKDKPSKLDHEGLARLFDNIVFSDVEVQICRRVYGKGDRVRVTLGSFAGLQAEVIEATAEDMVVMCQMFGRSMPVRITAANMDAIELVEAAA